MNKQKWWIKVTIALAAPLLARTYGKRAGAVHGVDEGGVGLEDWGGNHAGAKLW